VGDLVEGDMEGLKEGRAVGLDGLAVKGTIGPYGLEEEGLLEGTAEGLVGLVEDGRLVGGKEPLTYDTI
jgi:hypothetical protein